MGEDKNLPDVDSASEDSNSNSTPPEPEVQEEVKEEPNSRVRMRNKTPITTGIRENGTSLTVGDPLAAIQRTMMGALYEASPDVEDNNEGKLY